MQILKMVHNIYHDHLLLSQNKKNWKFFSLSKRPNAKIHIRGEDYFFNCKQNARAWHILVLYSLETWDGLVSENNTFGMSNVKLVAMATYCCSYHWLQEDYLDPITRSYTAGVLSTGPLSDLRYRQVRLDLRFSVRMRARHAPLSPITADCHRLPGIGYSRPSSWPERCHAVWRQRYLIMVVKALTEQIAEPIVFWFVIFGFVTKCVIHCMFELKATDVNGMQDFPISTKTWNC